MGETGLLRANSVGMMPSIPVIALIAIGSLLLVVGGIWAIVVAFRRSLVWGLCYLFVPFAALVFVFVAWADVRRAFFTNLIGCAILCGGLYLAIPPGMDLKKQFGAQFEQGFKVADAVTVPDPQAALAKRFAELSTREKTLLARKSALDPQDTAAAQALTAEILHYNDDLKAATAERAGQGGLAVSSVPNAK